MVSKEQILDLLSNPGKQDSKGNVRANCPWCGKPRFYINLKMEDYPFQCWRMDKCGAKGRVKDLLRKLNQTELLNSLKGINVDEQLHILILDNLIKKQEINLEIKPTELPLGFKRTYYDDYLNSRHFTNYNKYVVGYTNLISKYKDYIIIGIQQQNEIKAFISRYIGTDENKMRYLNSKSDFTKLICGYDDITDKTRTLIIVEGFFSKINVDRLLNLDNQEDVKCIATFGCKVSDEQLELLKLKNIETVILLYDDNIPKEVTKYFYKLNAAFTTFIAKIPYVGKDPGQFNEEQLNDVLINHLMNGDVYFASNVKIRKLN